MHSSELVMIVNIGSPDWLVTNNICIETFVKVVVWICQICHIDLSKLVHVFIKLLHVLFAQTRSLFELKLNRNFKAC